MIDSSNPRQSGKLHGDKKVNQNWLVTIFFFALLAGILYLSFLILVPFLKPIAWAAILAITVYPVYAWLKKLLRGWASLAALIMTLTVSWLFLFPVFQIAGFLSHEALELAKTVRDLANGEGVESWREKPWVNELLRLWDVLSFHSAAWEIDLRQAVIQGTQLGSAFLVAQVKEIAQDIFSFTVNFIIALVTFFFFLRDGKVFCERLRSLLPMDRREQARLFETIVNSIDAVIHGCLITALVQGLLAGAAYWFLGVPFSALLGVATAFAALFPIGGSALIWLPASLYLFVQGTPIKAIVLLVWGAGIVAGIDNILRPVLIGNRLKLSSLFLFFSILGGLALFGVLGLILGPVLFALLAALLDLYLREYVRG